MSLRALIFIAWCAVLLLGVALAAVFAWSPYADAHHGRGGSGVRGGHGAYYGPMHK